MYYQTHNLDYIYNEPTNTECIICFQNDFLHSNYTTLKSFNYQKSIYGCECNHFIHKNCINKWYESIPFDKSYKCILCNRECSPIDVLNFIMLKKKLFYMNELLEKKEHLVTKILSQAYDLLPDYRWDEKYGFISKEYEVVNNNDNDL